MRSLIAGAVAAVCMVIGMPAVAYAANPGSGHSSTTIQAYRDPGFVFPSVIKEHMTDAPGAAAYTITPNANNCTQPQGPCYLPYYSTYNVHSSLYTSTFFPDPNHNGGQLCIHLQATGSGIGATVVVRPNFPGGDVNFPQDGNIWGYCWTNLLGNTPPYTYGFGVIILHTGGPTANGNFSATGT